MGTLKLRSNAPLYNNSVIRTLAVNVVTFDTARKGLGARAVALPPPLLAVPNVTAHLAVTFVKSTASVPTS